MDADRLYYQLLFPEKLTAEDVEGFVLNLNGLHPGNLFKAYRDREAVVVEIWGDDEGIHHRVGIPTAYEGLVPQLRNHLRGIDVSEDTTFGAPVTEFSIASEFGMTSTVEPMLIENIERAATTLLTPLYPLELDEVAMIQLVISLSPKQAPKLHLGRASTGRNPIHYGGKSAFYKAASLGYNTYASKANQMGHRMNDRAQQREYEHQLKVEEKWQGQMFSVAIRIAAYSPDDNRVVQLHNDMASAMQSLGAGKVRFFVKRKEQEAVLERVERGAIPSFKWPCLVNTKELSALLAFPIGKDKIPGITYAGTYQAPPPPKMPTREEGRVFAETKYGNITRDIVQPWPQTTRHTYVVGKTGSGKSTLLENLAIQDMEHGNGVLFIDPIGDSADRLADSIPDGRVQDVIFFDPTNSEAVVGMNLLESGVMDPNLAGSNFVSLMQKLFSTAWGPNMEVYLKNAVQTLAVVPDVTILDIYDLFISPRFRHTILDKYGDQLSDQVHREWKRFESLKPDIMQQHIQPVLTKLAHFAVQPTIRHVVGQAHPALNMSEIIDSRKIVIAKLGKRKIGEPDAKMLGSILLTMFWTAALFRDTAGGKALDFYCYADEFQDILGTPETAEQMLTQGRGRNIGLVFANQYPGQLVIQQQSRKVDIAQAVLSNANSQVYFRTEGDDADRLAKMHRRYLKAEDFENLGKHEVIASILTGSTVRQRPLIGFTKPALPTTGTAQAVLEHTKNYYAAKCDYVDEQIRERRMRYDPEPARYTAENKAQYGFDPEK